MNKKSISRYKKQCKKFVFSHKGLLHSIILFFLCLPLLYTFNRGILYNDEGYILEAAQRIIHNQIPYKDFFIAYTPGSFYFTALAFKLFGESILSGRIIALIISIISANILYFIIFRFSKSFLLSILTVAIYISWGPMHINFSWPNLYALWGSFINIWCIGKFLEKNDRKYLFLAGVSVVLVILFKQNFGLAVLISNISLFLLVKKYRHKNVFLLFFLGIFLTSILFFFSLVISGNTASFLYNFKYFFFYKLVIQGYDATPFIYPDTIIKMILRTSVYLFVPVISIIAILVSLQKKAHYTFFAIFCLLFYIFGIRPVTDYVHLVPLISLVGLPLAVLYVLAKKQLYRVFLLIIMVSIIGLGAYTALYMNYYRWENPIIKNTSFIDHPRVQIWSDQKYAESIANLDRYVSSKTKKDDFIFINYFAPSLYVILDRKNPTRFIYLSPNVIDQKYKIEIVKLLDEKKVKLVMTHAELSKGDNSYLATFIYKHYKFDRRVSGFNMWVR